jgi:pimeloyl-ACP methyl ester carboxylesterase
MLKGLFRSSNLWCFVAGLAAGFLLVPRATTPPMPDLARLYEQSMAAPDQPPVVFIHGILGSRLRDAKTDTELWLGSLLELITTDHDRLALEFDPETLEVQPDRLEAFAIADHVAGQDFYGNILTTLREFGHYQRSEVGTPAEPGVNRYYEFYYDWRQDNVVSAARLADFIDQIREDYDDPNLKVDIVAHSMGGLVARYYVRYGRLDTLDDNDFPVNLYGAKRVRRLILLGTPNLGAVNSLNAFLDGYRTGFRKVETETFATMPSFYQLLPHPLNDWIVTADGRPLKRDLFDVEIWRRFQWSIFDPAVRKRILARFEDATDGEAHLEAFERYFEKRLERARRFVWSLTVPLPAGHPKIVVFGGDCTLTPARIVVEEVDGESLVRMYPAQIANPVPGVDYDSLMLEPGDGSVTKASLLARNTLDPSVPRHKYSFFPLDHAVLLCEKHNALTGNVEFRNNLLNELLSRD